MKSKKASRLVALLTAGAILFPSSSEAQTISGHIGNVLNKSHYSEIGESLPNIELILKNLNNNHIVAELTTDDNGNFRYNFTSVREPNFRFNINNIQEVQLYDIHGRLIKTLYDNFTLIPNLPSGSYISRAMDDKGNTLDKLIANIEGDIHGLYNNPEAEKYYKNSSFTDEIIPVEILIRDDNTNEIGDFYDFRDTLNINLDEDLELFQDLIPVWEIEPDTIMSNYRNNLHQVKHMTQTDPNYYPANERYPYLGKWYSYPVAIFFNREDDQGYNVQALETAINNWESSTSYEDYSPLDILQESREEPRTGILMDYTTQRASGTAIADEWERYDVDGQRFYAPKIITVYIGNTLGNRYNLTLWDTRHELGHAIMASRAHSINQTDVMTGGGGFNPPNISEGFTIRYIVLEKPFARTWNYLED